MSGHVSMMNDVLITQLPHTLLRSTLRYIVSQVPEARALLGEQVRARFKETPPVIPEATGLFDGDDQDTTRLEAYLRDVRCMFSCHMVTESLPYFVHLLQSIVIAKSSWSRNSPLAAALQTSSADIIQAIQAIKESPAHEDTPEKLLLDLHTAIGDCNNYCETHSLSCPYDRAGIQVKDAISLLFPSSSVVSAKPRSERRLDFTAESLVERERMEYTELGTGKGGLGIPRMLNGFWQMSSPAWGSASSEKIDTALVDLVRNGLLASDMADHYGDAELVYGTFRNSLPEDVAAKVICATKWCVFTSLKESPTRESVLAAVEARSKRVGGRVELLQFHWQDYSNKDYLIIIKFLVDLTVTRPDLVLTIGLCNFDSDHTAEVCEYMIQGTGSVGIVSNQVQYSLIDSRPIFAMTDVCEKYGIKLLTYGSFCGGFLSDKWLSQPAPDVYSTVDPLTPSQRKINSSFVTPCAYRLHPSRLLRISPSQYYDMISAWSAWSTFQTLLTTLKRISTTHSVDISNIATRWVLQRPSVGAVIVGTRLGVSSNVEANLRVFGFELTDQEIEEIEQIALGDGRARARELFEKCGDCGQEYR